MEIAEVIKRAGGLTVLAKIVSRHHATVLRWTRVPAEHARAIEQATGIPRHELRPDLWDPPAGADQAAAEDLEAA
jgi:DNA-binding transcriptional regulator YdaS (Cro superfamily)